MWSRYVWQGQEKQVPEKKTAWKTTPGSAVQKSTFETDAFKKIQSSPNVAINAKLANRYNTKTAPIIAYVHSISPPQKKQAQYLRLCNSQPKNLQQIKQEALQERVHACTRQVCYMPSHQFQWNLASIKGLPQNSERCTGFGFGSFRGEVGHPPGFTRFLSRKLPQYRQNV